jgi:AraC family transcriptional activator of pobA
MPVAQAQAPPRRRARRQLPAFALYGEAARPGLPLLHVEAIQTRSRLYQWEIGSHLHQGLHQVVFVQRGPVQSLLDESRAASQGPLAITLPAGVAHAFRFSAASDGHVLTFDARSLAEGDAGGLADALALLFAQPRRLALPPPEAARLHALFGALLAEHESASPQPVTLWLARAVLWRLAERAHRADAGAERGRPHAAPALYTRWVALMEAHYREHWPVTRYAAQLGLSAERLNRLVRAETGRNAQALLHARLVREATRRLVHIAAPVSSIAFELGFEDPAYFCRFFKRHTGSAPREYRTRLGAAGAPGGMR